MCVSFNQFRLVVEIQFHLHKSHIFLRVCLKRISLFSLSCLSRYDSCYSCCQSRRHLGWSFRIFFHTSEFCQSRLSGFVFFMCVSSYCLVLAALPFWELIAQQRHKHAVHLTVRSFLFSACRRLFLYLYIYIYVSLSSRCLQKLICKLLCLMRRSQPL